MKKIILLMVFFVFSILLVNNLVFAHQGEIEEGKNLVESGISCDELSDENLEAIGDYYMGQMHPGEAHEMMDNMMGGEGSESLKQMHIQMAKVLYCGESSEMMGSGEMMGMMNMMGGGMMGKQTTQTDMTQGMMGNWNYFGAWNLFNILCTILLIGLIILVYLLIIKLLRDFYGKKK